MYLIFYLTFSHPRATLSPLSGSYTPMPPFAIRESEQIRPGNPGPGVWCQQNLSNALNHRFGCTSTFCYNLYQTSQLLSFHTLAVFDRRGGRGVCNELVRSDSTGRNTSCPSAACELPLVFRTVSIQPISRNSNSVQAFGYAQEGGIQNAQAYRNVRVCLSWQVAVLRIESKIPCEGEHEFRVSSFEFRVSSFEFRVSSFEFPIFYFRRRNFLATPMTILVASFARIAGPPPSLTEDS